MAVYIFQETEPFAAIFERMRERGTDIAAQAEVRRPTRGLQLEKETYAYLKVVDINNQELPFINAGATYDEEGIGYSNAYSNFLLQSVQIQRAELKQFVKTFGTIYLFLFGENPIMVTVQGALVKSADFRWDEEWWVNYESMLRASRLAERGARAYLCYDGVMIEGYIINATTSRISEQRHLVPLGFEMVATDVKFLAKVGSVEFPVDRSKIVEPATIGGFDVNRLIPEGWRLQYQRQGAVGILRGAVEAGATGEAAGIVSGLQGGNYQFGSFGEMFRTIKEAPFLLAGVGTGYVLSAAESGLAEGLSWAKSGHGTGRTPPKPIFGKISLNADEYVTGLPRSGDSARASRSRLQSFHQSQTDQQDRETGGEAVRQTTEADPYSPPTSPADVGNMVSGDLSGTHGITSDPTVSLNPAATSEDLNNLGLRSPTNPSRTGVTPG